MSPLISLILSPHSWCCVLFIKKWVELCDINGLLSWRCDHADIQFSDTPRLHLSTPTEQFTSDRVTVLLEWTFSLSQIYYQCLPWNVSIFVVPDTEVTRGNMSAQLTLQYNTLYNVSLTQPGICGQPNQTEFIHLNYSKSLVITTVTGENGHNSGSNVIVLNCS